MTDEIKTHNPVDIAIDEAGRKAHGAVQWLLEKRESIPITYGNALKFVICGEEGFKEIEKDIRNARSTVDIVCWGFDPGMELVRTGKKWKRGHTYGELLDEITTRAKNRVRVRLLIWHDLLASTKQNNMPGYTDAQRGPLGGPYGNRIRHDYCRKWWIDNLPLRNRGVGRNPNLQIVLRDISRSDVEALIDADPKEKDKPAYEWHNPVDEKGLLLNFPTHHQKPILIDYAYEDGRHAVGYVMGLNSVTDYWDGTKHDIDDPRRETWTAGMLAGEREQARSTQNPNKRLGIGQYRHARPLQDYACRVVGPALKRVHQNFERGWNLFAPDSLKTKELMDLPARIPTLPRNSKQAVQIVRTQPHEREKSIKELYFQATTYARKYIYIENQYFFYPEFARHLKEQRDKFCDAWDRLSNRPVAEVPRLHLFIVIPHPEDDGLIPRTFDTLTELGHGSAMPSQAELVDTGKVLQRYENAKDATHTIDLKDEHGNPLKVKATHKVLDRPSVEELESTLGMRVSVARLRTSGVVGGQMAYREIYIHSKLMLIDDVFVTLGSANLNQRSMSVDSEINIAATGDEWAAKLREQVFMLHSGGKICGTANRELVSEEFDEWTKQMKRNEKAMKDEKDLEGFILPFEDYRATTTMHAEVTVPSVFSTAIA
ncbi:phospholipase [Burkholderia diffusa]|uniref:Phospholipase n=1 Tax=Burkholderia diffusa TaxID=488732 RepID=A0AAW3PLC6_9BURK|nr:phospholipase D-like domain-containing protein [Burkholderia diffusa]KWF27480.1 phospholipase [Burkholderia diffusa]KWF43891.1 phospholipase [Burkholderia diffusa]KWF54752.1 phospholipase [Burkholderia diffusa]KWF57628.1 phospholipase [Burkholderia diffusa]